MISSLRVALALWAASVCIAFSAAAGVAGAQNAQPSLAGTWQLNEDRSEKYDPRRDRDLRRADVTGASVRTGMGSRTSGRSGGTAGGSSGTSATGGGAAASGSGGGDPQAMRAMREATQQPKTLRIEQTDSTVTVAGSGQPLTLRTDGQPSDDPAASGAKAIWKEKQLVVEHAFGPGTALRATYYLDKKNPKILVVDVHYEDKATRRVIDNRRIYEAASGGTQE